MPQQRMDIRMIKDILRLKYQGGLSHERIASSLSISKGVVAKYLSLPYSGAGSGLRMNQTLDPCQLTSRRPPFFPLTGRYNLYKEYEVETVNMHTWTNIKSYYSRLRGNGRVVP